MKHKITYILVTAVIALTAFLIGRNTATIQLETENNIETMENAMSQIEYWELTDE